MIFRLSMDARRSSGRLSLLNKPTSPSSVGNGIAPASSSRHGSSVEFLRNSVGKFERGLESNLYEQIDSNGAVKTSRSNSKPTTNGSAAQATTRTTTSQSSEAPTRVPGPSHIDPKDLPSMQVRLDPSQQRMLDWMNELKMDKYVTWYPDMANSHAVAICR